MVIYAHSRNRPLSSCMSVHNTISLRMRTHYRNWCRLFPRRNLSKRFPMTLRAVLRETRQLYLVSRNCSGGPAKRPGTRDQGVPQERTRDQRPGTSEQGYPPGQDWTEPVARLGGTPAPFPGERTRDQWGGVPLLIPPPLDGQTPVKPSRIRNAGGN